MNKTAMMKERGTEVLRCGTKRLVSTCVEKEQNKTFFSFRAREGGHLASAPHSAGLQSHAFSLRFVPVMAGIFLSLTAAVHAAPQAVSKDAKDTVQVQTALSGAGSSHAETNLGDLVADAVRQTGSAQVALIPSDEIDSGASIPAGKTEAGKIVAALHYAGDPGDTIVVVTLTGAQLLKVAERSVSRAPEPFDGFLQVSGLQIRYNANQPEGKRVSLVGAGGSEVDAGKAYRVAMTRSLAGGSLGYYQILTAKDISDDTGIPLSKSLSNYLAAHPVINSVVEDRVSSY